MKKIHYKKNHMKYHTRDLEMFVREFFYELSINHAFSYQVSLLEIDESENEITIGNYRSIDEDLKMDLQVWATAEDRTNFCGEKYYFSGNFSFENILGDFMVALKYDDTEYDSLIKEYLKFMVQHLLFMIQTSEKEINRLSDIIIYLKNQIYSWCREFINEKIGQKGSVLLGIQYLMAVTAVEEISKLPYESEALAGKFMAISTDNTRNCEIVLKTNSPIMLKEHKKVRKLLEITYQFNNDGLFLLYNREHIVGFISAERIPDNSYLIEFKGTGIWKFSQKSEHNSGQGIELRGVIPKIICNNNSFKEKFKKYFKMIFESTDKLHDIWQLVEKLKAQKHGTMIVILDNMEKEKRRLQNAGFEINIDKGISISKYIKQLAAIDGAILMDARGTVHAIGTILDGETPTEFDFDMSRGARYNSAIKYSYSHKDQKNLIVVFSEDGYTNLISGGKELD